MLASSPSDRNKGFSLSFFPLGFLKTGFFSVFVLCNSDLCNPCLQLLIFDFQNINNSSPYALSRDKVIQGKTFWVNQNWCLRFWVPSVCAVLPPFFCYFEAKHRVAHNTPSLSAGILSTSFYHLNYSTGRIRAGAHLPSLSKMRAMNY